MAELYHGALGYRMHLLLRRQISNPGTTGIVSVCMGTTNSYAGLVVCRFFLGLFEAGFFPGETQCSSESGPHLTKSRMHVLDLDVLP